jgi:perosamine synthetase
MQAALGLARTERLDELIAWKREAFGWYAERLSGLPCIALNNPGSDVESTYQMVSLVWEEAHNFTKQKLSKLLSAQFIDTRPFFCPLSSLGAYRDLPGVSDYRVRNHVSYRLANQGINLPSSLALTEVEVDRVCSVIRRIFQSF